MVTIRVTPNNLHEAAQQAAVVLCSGGVVVAPTDTAYGFTANGLKEETVEKVYRLKGRAYHNPIHLVVRDPEVASAIAEISEVQRAVLGQWLPGPMTFVLKRKPVVPPLLVSGGTTVGVRIPNHPVTQALSQCVDFPYTATSANISGRPAVYKIASLEEQFPGLEGIDLVLDSGELTPGAISTVVDITRWPQYAIIREGVVSAQKFGRWAAVWQGI